MIQRKVSLLILFLMIGLTYACVTGSKKSTKAGNGSSIHPEWYQGTYEMQDDSLYYSIHNTAVHQDSMKSISLAEKAAKHHLSIGLDELNESIRSSLVDDQGINALSSANFIIQLRRFSSFERDIKVANSEAVKTENGYQGFVKVQIAKKSFHSQMKTFLDRATTNANRDAWMSEY